MLQSHEVLPPSPGLKPWLCGAWEFGIRLGERLPPGPVQQAAEEILHEVQRIGQTWLSVDAGLQQRGVGEKEPGNKYATTLGAKHRQRHAQDVSHGSHD